MPKKWCYFSRPLIFPQHLFSRTFILRVIYFTQMPLTTNAIKKENDKFSFPFRIILSGSSGVGKTHFAGSLLKSNEIFEKEVKYIYYFHPCYLEEPPVNWHESMDVPVAYQTGLPSLEHLMNIPPYSVIVLDDLMDKCNQSEVIDQLFRVISGKRNISVMIMTQNYFAPGKFGRNIRNSCNYSVLLRNCCDATINRRAVRAMGLGKAFSLAEQSCAQMEYPYIFVDQTQKGQVSGYQIYTDIFGSYMKCYSNKGMPSYIIPEKDFLAVFRILSQKNRIILAQEKNEKTLYEELRNDSQGESTETTIESAQREPIEQTAVRATPYSRRRRGKTRRLA